MIILNFMFVFQLLLIYDTVNSLPAYKYLGVKTAYDDSIALTSDSSAHYNYTNCKPLYFTGVYRHGTRNPGNKDIDRIDRIYIQITRLSHNLDTVASLRRPFPSSTAKKLTSGGRLELQSIAERTASSFPSLLNSTASPHTTFVSSSLQRAKDSATAFAKGIRSRSTFKLHVRDDLMRYYFRCNQIRARHTRPNIQSLAKQQFLAFWTPERVESVASKIRIHLQAPKLKLTAHDLHSIYAYGATEFAVLRRSSWLHLLDNEDILQLEYAADLKKFWKKSYGEPVNYEQSCPLLVDMFTRIDNIIAGKSRMKAVVHFGHHGSLIRFASLLGLFQDTPWPTGINMADMGYRRFRQSFIGSFSANLAVVLYDCAAADAHTHADHAHKGSSHAHRYCLELRYNERPVPWPESICNGGKDGGKHGGGDYVESTTRCPYSAVRAHFADKMANCNLDAICSQGHDEL